MDAIGNARHRLTSGAGSRWRTTCARPGSVTCASRRRRSGFSPSEPLLERLHGLDLEEIHWVIVGGESGPGARPMKEDWVREIRDWCLAEGVPFFFKQWGGFRPKSNGRELDAREHNDMPMHTGRQHG